MNKKVLGILTPVLTIIFMIIVAILTAIIVNNTSSDGWAALGAIMMVFLLTGLLLLIELVIGLYLHFKKDLEYGVGILLGIGGIAAFSVIVTIISTIYNALINM